eukprot:g3346.t1
MMNLARRRGSHTLGSCGPSGGGGTFVVHPPATDRPGVSAEAREPVALIFGAGGGIGFNVAKRFAREGFQAALVRRSDAPGLERMVQDIRSAGGKATGILANAAKDNVIEDLVQYIESNVGPIEVAVYNLGAQIGNKSLHDTSLKQFTLGWKMAQFGLFRAAKCIFPHMVNRGSGTLLVTSATAAVRGNAGQHSHASAMGGRRLLCQTLNAEFSSQNIHVAHIIIDGAVDAPDTLGKMIGRENFEMLRDTRGAADGLVMPSAVLVRHPMVESIIWESLA